jgi:hypothetical protein
MLLDWLLVHVSSVASRFCFSVIKPTFRWEHITFGCVKAHVPGADEQRACLGNGVDLGSSVVAKSSMRSVASLRRLSTTSSMNVSSSPSIFSHTSSVTFAVHRGGIFRLHVAERLQAALQLATQRRVDVVLAA